MRSAGEESLYLFSFLLKYFLTEWSFALLLARQTIF